MPGAQITEQVDATHFKGSVRVSGEWVPLGYWLLRRPWASVRSWLAW